MADTELISTALKPDGARLLTPPLGDSARYAYRIEMEGVLTFDYTGEQFDPVYRRGPEGPFTRKHTILQWTPRAPVLVSEDRALHRYVFSLPREWKLNGQSVGVSVDVNRFVDEYLIPPSEVRRNLTGEFRLTVFQAPLTPPSIWPMVAWTALPAALVLGGAGLVIRRRMALAGLSADLQTALGRIERKYREARSALRNRSSHTFTVGGQLDTVRAGAVELIRRIQNLRNIQRLADRRALRQETAALEKRLRALTDPAARREGEVALAEKRKTLDLLDEVERAESRSVMRLAKIEAVLQAAGVTLRSVKLETPAAPVEESLRGELDAEVAAIREVAREVSACEALQAQVVTGSR